jgi:hypothetical protein
MYFSCELHFASFYIFFIIAIIISCSMVLLLSMFMPFILITVWYFEKKHTWHKAAEQWDLMFYKRRVSCWLAKWPSSFRTPILLEIYQIKEIILLSVRRYLKPWHILLIIIHHVISHHIPPHYFTFFSETKKDQTAIGV